jgi:hypothetical protein
MEDLWRTLYKEEHNFYNISENNFKKKNIEILAILHNVFMQPILIGIILFLIFPSECKYLFGVSLLLAFVIYFTVILVYSFWENNKQDS